MIWFSTAWHEQLGGVKNWATMHGIVCNDMQLYAVQYGIVPYDMQIVICDNACYGTVCCMQ